ncbi:hydrogenase maturation protein HypF [Geosporobacter subterraneus DSM 17957]|uniref:Carbamoyltransferase n=1 Tax=Geosporobacter subterraneus DSM 17957 TaxID=1121919 RepID=A0A1M6D0M2_9FIRM|nr:carbamoyltransferase HypF [Geosporobacter subterraneus]SHI66614.1 hydrogenase maturation protein HypF [Geosporobacter subterraneus DSM 17957]
MRNYRRFIKVTGIVQGVGFRPFVYRIALEEHLKGWVNNTAAGVLIEVEGSLENLEAFQKKLIAEAPPLSKVEEITVKELPFFGYDSFGIEKSNGSDAVVTLISPDVSICSQCKEDINNPDNHRFGYPFTNCTNCGPRFSIIQQLPYDREMTTMKSFPMCGKCREEYENPLDRRFHAQPNACPDCGPKVWLTDQRGNPIDTQDPIREARLRLKAGAIIGLKGLGGFQLVCDGKKPAAVQILRERKRRPWKPFALMMRDLKTIGRYCHVSEKEEEILTGIQKPILLLDKKNEELPESIAPKQNRLGIMLPYTPLHHLLFDDSLEVLVMTSGNISGLPIEYKNEEAILRLGEIVDYFLLHNREIHIPVDDSVSRVVLGKERLIRRSRGYAPIPMKIEGIEEILACGSHLKNTFCISKKDMAFLGQHIGDLENLETYQHFQVCVDHFKAVYGIKPKMIAHDLHPEYLSTLYAENEEGYKEAIQHHHAHVASCMAEHGIEEPVIGIAYDGTGYGTDGKIWGGEFLLCNYDDFQRVGRLNYMKMPGGEAAIKEPWRMALSQLYALEKEDFRLPQTMDVPVEDMKGVIQLLRSKINSPETSSMGRLFDSVAGLLGISKTITYEAQGAIELEGVADLSEAVSYSYKVEMLDGCYVVNTLKMFEEILGDIEKGTALSKIAGRFHKTVICFTLELCCTIQKSFGISKVVLSGGVFQNEILLEGIYSHLSEQGFQVYTHEQIPCNDGGVALGQLVIANRRMKRGENHSCV